MSFSDTALLHGKRLQALVSARPRLCRLIRRNVLRDSKAFEIVLSLVKPRDKIYCIHANNGTHDEATLERVTRTYTEEIELLAPIGSKFVMLQPIGGKDTETTIIDYLNESTDIEGGPAFVAIAPRAREARQAQESGFSSLTKNLMMKVNSNMIIVKHH